MASTTHLRRWRRTATALAAVAALASTALLAAPVASAHPKGHHGSHHHAHHRPGYLALGDSVPFGYLPTAITPPEVYADPANLVGYPEKLARRLHLRLSNASCPGETSASLLDVTAQSNGCSNSLGSPTGYRSLFPLHASYTGSQIDYAVSYLRHHRHTRLVTLMIGANDLFLCQKTTPDQCTGADFAQTAAQVAANVDTTLTTLREAAHYRHRVVVVSYYSLDYADPVGTAGIAALNGAISSVAEAHHASVADGFGAFQRASEAAGGDTCAAGLRIPLPDGTCDIHPTQKGHRVLARAVARALR